jgi:putative DNA primase/helicase
MLAVAEGIETALSFAQLFGVPSWAALGTANLASFEPPAGLRKLWIAGDPGEAGIEAARRLAQRVRTRMEVMISRPDDAPGDWNDVLKRRAN